jgi:hypothetical protein
MATEAAPHPCVYVMNPFVQGLLIDFLGGLLYFLVDKYEPDRALAYMLKCTRSCAYCALAGCRCRSTNWLSRKF